VSATYAVGGYARRPRYGLAALRQSRVGAALVALASSAMVALYVAPMIEALRLPGPVAAPVALPALTLPPAPFPLLRVPHVQPLRPLPPLATVRPVAAHAQPAVRRIRVPVV